MNIDERLEKLVERHEALSQSVELLAIESRNIAMENRKIESAVIQIMQGIADLVSVVRSHEQRLSNLEQN